MNRIQELYLQLFAYAHDQLLADLLIVNDDLWRAAFPTWELDQLLPLRNLSAREAPTLPTLYLTPVAGKEDDLYRLALVMAADEITWLDASTCRQRQVSFPPELNLDPNRTVLRLWWD